MLLAGSDGELGRGLLDVGGDEEGFELLEREAPVRTPGEEAARGPAVGFPCVGIP